jgi:hypothetical protein
MSYVRCYPALAVYAASASQADVQAAIDAATPGQTIVIPAGNVTWTSGVTVNKRVTISGSNFNPTSLGRSNQSVVITNAASVPLFTMTTGNDYHTGLVGLKLLEGTRTSNHIHMTGTGSRVGFINDCYIDQIEHFSEVGAEGIASIWWNATGGIWCNSQFVNSNRNVDALGGATICLRSPHSWETPSTMGDLDANGNINLYIEDCTIFNVQNWLDMDDNTRVVGRHCLIDGSSCTHHGLTSSWGARHSEWYDNHFTVTTLALNMAARYLWVRGGTTLLTDNVVDNCPDPSTYGNVAMLIIGDHSDDFGSYPINRQPGWGHNGTSNASAPIYAWNNTGTRGSTLGWISAYWETICAPGRDVLLDTGAKPGWVKYAYPHPLRSEL